MNKIKRNQLALTSISAEAVGFSILLYTLFRITQQGVSDSSSQISISQILLLATGSILVLTAIVSIVQFIRLYIVPYREGGGRKLHGWVLLTILLAFTSQFMYILMPLTLLSSIGSFSLARKQSNGSRVVVIAIAVAAAASIIGFVSVFAGD